jgi:hypothetical protein
LQSVDAITSHAFGAIASETNTAEFFTALSTVGAIFDAIQRNWTQKKLHSV